VIGSYSDRRGGGRFRAWTLNRVARCDHRRAAAVSALGLAAVLAILVTGALWWTLRDEGKVVDRVTSPDGRLELVVVETAAAIDPVWLLHTRSIGRRGDGKDAGCLNGDDPDDAYRSARWLDDAQLEVTLEDDRRLVLGVDATGSPRGRVTSGAGC
jgi:hypothetical protein